MIHAGKKLKVLLEMKRISVDEMAKKLNVERDTLYKAFNREEISSGRLLQVCEILNLSPNEFLEWGRGPEKELVQYEKVSIENRVGYLERMFKEMSEKYPLSQKKKVIISP